MTRDQATKISLLHYSKRPLLVRKKKPPRWDYYCENKFDPSAKWRWTYSGGMPLLEYPYPDNKYARSWKTTNNFLAYFVGFCEEYTEWEIAPNDLWEELIW